MTDRSDPTQPLLPVDVELRIDTLCEQFKAARQAGQQPCIESFLGDVPESLAAFLFRALLSAECELRSAAGERPSAPEYVARFPHYADIVTQVLAPGPLPETIDLANPALTSTLDLASPDNDRRSISDTADSQIASDRTLGKFGEYELIEEIARGGMGVVYKAQQKRLNRTVALKMILAGTLASNVEVKRFYTEARAAAALDHSGIVPIYEVGEQAGQHFFSMAYVDGESLESRLRNGPLPPRDAAELLHAIAEATHYAHTKGIIHRDLKPHNILLEREGKPKITDFGLAKRIDSREGMTNTGDILGTPSYMAPEQARGELSAIAATTDIYALGAIFYAMITGRPPFQAGSLPETLRQVSEQEPVPPSLLNPDIPQDLETICLKCLEKDPRRRYASSLDVADELQRFLRGEPILSRPVSHVERGWRWCRRNPIQAALIAAVLFSVVAGGSAWWNHQRARQATQQAELQGKFEDYMDAIELKGEFLQKVDTTVDALSLLDQQMAENARRRLHDAFLAAIEQAIAQPRLSPADVQRIQAAIAMFSARDSAASQLLSNRLQQRLSDWISLVDLKAPYARAEEAFAPGMAEVRGEWLSPVSPAREVRVVRSHDQILVQDDQSVALAVGSEQNLECEVVFHENWQLASQLGIAIDVADNRETMDTPAQVSLGDRLSPPTTRIDGIRGYSFVLLSETTQYRTLDADGELVSTPLSFEQQRAQQGQFVLDIRKRETILQRAHLPCELVQEGPLRMRIVREQGRLSVQVNQCPPLEFHDVFGLRLETAGAVAIDWPENVGLLQMKVRHKVAPIEPSVLQEGDQQFADRNYAQALECYDRVAGTAADDQTRQESQYKASLCLMALDQLADAEPRLQRLMFQQGEIWPALAGCELWLQCLLKKRTEDADGIFEHLSSRFSFDRLASAIPSSQRRRILQSYFAEFSSIPKLLRQNPKRRELIERAYEIDRLLSHDGNGSMQGTLLLIRACRFDRQFDQALRLCRDEAERTKAEWFVRNCSRLLRQQGKSKDALEFITGAIDDIENRNGTPPPAYWIELSRIAADNRQWELAEQHIDRAFADSGGLANSRAVNCYAMSHAVLIKGLLQQRRGDDAAALHTWQQGYEIMRDNMARLNASDTTLVILTIVGSLAGTISDAELDQFVRKGTANAGNDSVASTFVSIINRDSLSRVLRTMWLSERGRDLAWQIAFETIDLADRVRLPIILAASTYAQQNAFRGDMDQQQKQIVWDCLKKLLDAYLIDGTLSAPQLVQFGLAWKGTTNFLGWGGLAPTLSPEIRGQIAYLLAHRYLLRNNPQQAKLFLQQAVDDAQEDAGLHTIAKGDLQMVNNGHGRLLVNVPDGQPLRLTLKDRDGKQTVFEVAKHSSIELAAENYQLQIQDPLPRQQLSKSNAQIPVGGRIIVDVVEAEVENHPDRKTHARPSELQ